MRILLAYDGGDGQQGAWGGEDLHVHMTAESVHAGRWTSEWREGVRVWVVGTDVVKLVQ